ncbi:hypothetical protein C8Q75DRAFT_723927 [Abortiporus biennis]|nr:hypothetical protein C8Q75DRAFT_723927 [Abortiporus biennis]
MKSIPLGNIYACLFSRGDGTFHWAIVIPKLDGECMKYHAVSDDKPWRYVCASDNLQKDIRVCVVVKLGVFANRTYKEIDEFLKQIPMKAPPDDLPQRFTCRIWFKEAIRVLNKRGVIRCTSVNSLETELRMYGEEHWRLTELGSPPKLYDSDYSC